jgi:glycosyltransferase involved in cell wall biosynthesis
LTVVHVYGAYVPSRTEGISANVHGLCQALARGGVAVRSSCPPADLRSLNRRRAVAAAAWRSAQAVRRACEDAGTTLVHQHVSLLSTAAPARLLRRRGGPPLLLHAWNAYHEGGTRPSGIRLRDRAAHRLANGPESAAFGLRGARDLVVSSAFQERQVRDVGFRGRVHVVPNGVDLAVHRPRTAEEAEAARRRFGLDGDPVLLYYGHASPWKGLRTLAAALPALLAEHPRLQVLLSLTDYGGDGAWLDHDLRAKGLESRVRRIGPTDVAALHAAADFAVLPAPAPVGTACLPNVLLECMAGGVPIAATRVGAVPEAVVHGRTGVLSTPGDAADLAGRLDDLAGDPVLRRRLSAEARRTAESRFGWDHVAQRMVAVYRQVGADLPGSPAPLPVSLPLPAGAP